MSTSIVCKYPPNTKQSDDGNDEEFVAWHQDLKYWGVSPLEEVTVWIAIDNTDEENGGMKFLPGTKTCKLAVFLFHNNVAV